MVNLLVNNDSVKTVKIDKLNVNFNDNLSKISKKDEKFSYDKTDFFKMQIANFSPISLI